MEFATLSPISEIPVATTIRRIAENRLYEEIALAMDTDRDEVKDYIRKYIENKQAV